MICLVLFRFDIELHTFANNGRCYGRLSFFIMLISKLSVLFFLTVFDFYGFCNVLQLMYRLIYKVLDVYRNE